MVKPVYFLDYSYNRCSLLHKNCSPRHGTCICKRCGQGLLHDWDTMHVCRCDQCGEYAYEEYHQWESLKGSCRKRCKICGILAYDHDYQIKWEDKVGDSFGTGYSCSVCGHSWEELEYAKSNAHPQKGFVN